MQKIESLSFDTKRSWRVIEKQPTWELAAVQLVMQVDTQVLAASDRCHGL